MARGFKPLVMALALAVGATGLALPESASALSYVMMEDEALLAQAEGVVRMRVIAALPSRDGDQETRYRIEIEQALAGAMPEKERILVLPGTFNAPNLNRIVYGVPRLVEGQTYLLFYSARSDGALQAQQLTLGLFGRSSGASPTYVRFLDEESEIAPAPDKRLYHAARDAAKFERWISRAARGQVGSPDYFVAQTDVDRAKFNFQSFGFSTPGPGRFFQFDSNQTMPWTALPGGQTGAASDVYNSLAQALAAWTNDAGSLILMSYTGTASQAAYANNACSSSTAPACFTGFVKWNDPDNEITGSFNCSSGGVLGIGGSSAFSFTGVVSGMTWYRRASAFVVVQDNAACSMDSGNGANGAELLTHEVGHSIAFGHSCGDSASGTCQTGTDAASAIMRASLQGNGRGATLGSDDIAGAAVVYPAPGGGGSNVGPTLSANTPASGSTTAMAGGSVGAIVSSNILFSVSGGSGSGTTSLSCSVSSGTVTIASGTPQTISVGGSASAVVARFTLSSAAQSGTIGCTATPQGGSAASFTYNFTAPAGSSSAPENNDFASATTISGSSATLSGSNVGANKESGEPSHAGNNGGASVWWQWTAPASGSATITTSGSSFDTVLAVYTGSSVAALSSVGFNDDDPSGGTTSRVSFDASAGTTYRIAVDGFNGTTGSITLNLTGPTSGGGGSTCSAPCIFRDGFE